MTDLANTLMVGMVDALRERPDVLDDEPVAMALLTSKGFRAGDIVALIDDALAEARRQHFTSEDPEWSKDAAWGGR
jgi:hypothetical protein